MSEKTEGEKNCLEFELQHFAMIKLQPEPFRDIQKMPHSTSSL
jgi:hypothetical protein